MNWKKEAEYELRNYTKMKEIVIRNTELIEQIEYEIITLRGARIDGTPVSGGTNEREDWLVDNISKKNELEIMIVIAKKHIDMVECGLLAVTEEERRILRLFFVDRPKDYIDRLCCELGYEQSSLYYHKDIALRKFTLAPLWCYRNVILELLH